MAASQQEKPVKLTNSIPQLPSVTTPHFSGGKLARIRRKIEEKQILLDGGVPVQFLKQIVTLSEEEDEESTLADGDETIKEKATTSIPIKEITGEKGEGGDLILCNTCGRSFSPARIQLHQKICGGSADKLSTIPFIVKLGIRKVDGEKDQKAVDGKAAARLAVQENGNEENSQTEVLGGRQGRIEANQSEEFGISPKTIQYPGGGNNWKEDHNRFIKCLEEAKQVMEQYTSGNFPRLPPPPGPRELEMDFVQCPNCLRRLAPESSSNHLVKCTSRVKIPTTTINNSNNSNGNNKIGNFVF